MEQFEHDEDDVQRSQIDLDYLGVLLQLLNTHLSQAHKPANENVFRDFARRLDRRERRPIRIGKEHAGVARVRIHAIQSALGQLENKLKTPFNAFDARQTFAPPNAIGGSVSLGTAAVWFDRRRFLRGHVDCYETLAISPPLSPQLVFYFLAIPRIRDQLERENHGWGYHYHYVDDRSRRSDTLLTFDRNSVNPVNPTLCWERHAEGDKFKARAGKWGQDKRQSIYSVCLPDTLRWSLAVFKQPGAGAASVWP